MNPAFLTIAILRLWRGPAISDRGAGIPEARRCVL